MNKYDTQMALEKIGDAKAQWAEAITEFNTNIDRAMYRLLHEAAFHMMSTYEVAKATHKTVKQVRTLMRKAGLDPRNNRTLLQETAAKALRENADLLGINPHEMDLTSPLAYLPMGDALRRDLAARNISRVTELPEDTVLIRIDRETWEEHVANGECPVSSGCCGCHLDGAVQA